MTDGRYSTSGMNTTTSEVRLLRKVERATAQLEDAVARRDRALVEAHGAGHSLRTLATATGLAHENVRRIITRTTLENKNA